MQVPYYTYKTYHATYEIYAVHFILKLESMFLPLPHNISHIFLLNWQCKTGQILNISTFEIGLLFA